MSATSAEKSPFLNSISNYMHVRRYSKRTIRSYLYWIRYFIVFHQMRHPREMAAPEVEVEGFAEVEMEADEVEVEDFAEVEMEADEVEVEDFAEVEMEADEVEVEDFAEVEMEAPEVEEFAEVEMEVS